MYIVHYVCEIHQRLFNNEQKLFLLTRKLLLLRSQNKNIYENI
jgi:hypothetical protein